MSDLNPEARKLVRMARGEVPPPGDKERLRALLAARMDVPQSPPPPEPGSGLSLLGKVGVGAGLLGAVALAVVTARSPEPLSGPAPAVPAVAQASAASAAVEPPAVPTQSATPAPAAPEQAAPEVGTSSAARGTPRPAPEADSLQAELALLTSAREALARGDLGETREALAKHQAKFPRGALAHERSMLSMQVACRSGQAASVREQVRVFLEQHPRSPYAVALRAACSEP